MPAPRQQRANTARGQLMTPNVYPSAVVPWSLEVSSLTAARMVIRGGGRIPKVISIPQLQAGSTGPFPTVATESGGNILLTFPAGAVVPGNWTLPPGDPGIRFADGCYLAPSFSEVTTVPYPAPIPAYVVWFISANTGGVLTIHVNTAGVNYGGPDVADFYNGTAGQHAVSAVIAGPDITVTFPAPVNPGDQIIYPHTADNVIFNDGSLLDHHTEPSP